MIPTQTYIHLMRLVADMFEPNELERLAPRVRGGPRLAESNGNGLAGLDPIAVTEAIAYDFLAKGGKYFRPFVTLAAYDALTGSRCTGAHGADHAAKISDAVRRTALSAEIFHKASLVHDDIEDNDAFRYGEPTIHHAHGIPTAINVGDYLIGMGYRLVSRDAFELGPDTATDILNRLADAHLRLSEGQGAELAWRDARNKHLTPRDALKVYTLKTAPAFEVALYSGIRLAGPADAHIAAIHQFAMYLGIAFQVLNDLKDWKKDQDNKLTSNGDVLGGRPTILLALALEGLQETDQNLLLGILSDKTAGLDAVEQVRKLYVKADVFQKAQMLVSRYQARMEEIAANLSPNELRTLAMYLIDTILYQTVEPEPASLHHGSRTHS